MLNGLIRKNTRLASRPLDPHQRDECCLSGLLVLAGLLAHLFLVAFHVQQVVGDLERQTQIMSVGMKGMALGFCRLAQDGPRFAGESDKHAGLHPLQAGHFLHLERVVLRYQVEHLSPHHAVRANGARQLHDQIATH